MGETNRLSADGRDVPYFACEPCRELYQYETPSFESPEQYEDLAKAYEQLAKEIKDRGRRKTFERPEPKRRLRAMPLGTYYDGPRQRVDYVRTDEGMADSQKLEFIEKSRSRKLAAFQLLQPFLGDYFNSGPTRRKREYFDSVLEYHPLSWIAHKDRKHLRTPQDRRNAQKAPVFLGILIAFIGSSIIAAPVESASVVQMLFRILLIVLYVVSVPFTSKISDWMGGGVGATHILFSLYWIFAGPSNWIVTVLVAMWGAFGLFMVYVSVHTHLLPDLGLQQRIRGLLPIGR